MNKNNTKQNDCSGDPPTQTDSGRLTDLTMFDMTRLSHDVTNNK